MWFAIQFGDTPRLFFLGRAFFVALIPVKVCQAAVNLWRPKCNVAFVRREEANQRRGSKLGHSGGSHLGNRPLGAAFAGLCACAMMLGPVLANQESPLLMHVPQCSRKQRRHQLLPNPLSVRPDVARELNKTRSAGQPLTVLATASRVVFGSSAANEG